MFVDLKNKFNYIVNLKDKISEFKKEYHRQINTFQKAFKIFIIPGLNFLLFCAFIFRALFSNLLIKNTDETDNYTDINGGDDPEYGCTDGPSGAEQTLYRLASAALRHLGRYTSAGFGVGERGTLHDD